ncbi:MAG: UDP-N-acetylmuramoyl-tripeptide--D-alanyl-D-alanine ligase [Betaproteobacteria bacterium]|nr:UDP-N-acetylmuramoyl-tripeptide--D-alanyl-D-alanine ligase [Betaproteobacteria bacterium]
MTLAEIAAASGARLIGADRAVTGVTTDSRRVHAGDLFVALKGDRFDAHDFVPDVVARGAAAVMVAREIPDIGVPQLIVADTRRGYGGLARAWRARFTAPTLALTGSNGKTTVKEMLRAILAAHTGEANAVHATEGNLNNDVGVPQTMLAQRAHHRFAIYEMGMNHLKEIEALSRLVAPDVALVIMAGTAHLGEVGSREAIAEAKGEIFAGLKPGGTAVINLHDRFGAYWQRVAQGHRQLTFGIAPGDDVCATFRPDGLDIAHGGECMRVNLQVPGRHNQLNALAATAGALALGVPLATCAKALAQFAGVPGRLRRFTGHNAATILDDTYNANPDSAKAAIDVLAALTPPRILVMGDMGELGADAPALHREVGAYARRAGIDALYAIGEQSRGVAEAFGADALHFTDHATLAAALRARLGAGTNVRANVLVKGSRFMQMERVVAELVPHYAGHH